MRLGLGAGSALLVACANVEAPPGGPPDTAPPAIMRVVPESGAVVPALKDPAVIQFDEVIEELPAGAGGPSPGAGVSGLARQVLLSPVAGEVDVSWRRSAIRIKPKEGWKRGRVYRLELQPGIADLRRNRLDSGRVVIFSTGPPLPSARVTGTALAWVEQRPLARAVIRAVLRPDTLAYLALADSGGAFTLAGIPAGEYIVYALSDPNGNRRRDRREAYDSSLVRVDSSASVVLWTFVHDSVGPRAIQAEAIDSLTFRLVFSQALDPRAPLDTGRVRVVALPDSTPVPVALVLPPKQYDSLAARERAKADSVAPAKRPAAPPAPDTGARRPDTSAMRRLLAARPVPSDRVVVRVLQPLKPEAKYLIRVTGATNLNGVAADGQVVLTMPKRPPPPAPRDTTKTPRDTTPPP
ncbi:MAG: Ig-like domain-containing protein [Gemmatimonadales bacterium]